MLVRVQTEPFDINDEIKAITHGRDDIGGVGSFLGLVRGVPGFYSLTLEHYPGMTEKTLEHIAATATTRFGLLDVTLIHRVGTLKPGDSIVLVLAAASHRANALAATEFLIDWLKTDAPFWKQEHTATGAIWVEARDSDEKAKEKWQDSPRHD
jgi:molybdopterin synthase catalytic subunit